MKEERRSLWRPPRNSNRTSTTTIWPSRTNKSKPIFPFFIFWVITNDGRESWRCLSHYLGDEHFLVFKLQVFNFYKRFVLLLAYVRNKFHSKESGYIFHSRHQIEILLFSFYTKWYSFTMISKLCFTTFAFKIRFYFNDKNFSHFGSQIFFLIFKATKMWDLLLVLNSGFKCHCAQVSRPDFKLFLCKTGSFQLNKTLFQMDATVPPAPDSLVFYSWLIQYRLWRRKQTNHLLSSEYPFNTTYFLIYLHAIKKADVVYVAKLSTFDFLWFSMIWEQPTPTPLLVVRLLAMCLISKYILVLALTGLRLFQRSLRPLGERITPVFLIIAGSLFGTFAF